MTLAGCTDASCGTSPSTVAATSSAAPLSARTCATRLRPARDCSRRVCKSRLSSASAACGRSSAARSMPLLLASSVSAIASTSTAAYSVVTETGSCSAASAVVRPLLSTSRTITTHAVILRNRFLYIKLVLMRLTSIHSNCVVLRLVYTTAVTPKLQIQFYRKVFPPFCSPVFYT